MSKAGIKHKNILTNSIHCGDSAILLKQISDDSIDLVITSPPYYQQRVYNYSTMGIGLEASVEKYLESLMDVFCEIIRIIKPSGNIVYNLGDKYVGSSLSLIPYRFALMASSQDKIKLVNNITWVKNNPTPRQFDRRLVSSTEPFFHFIKSSQYYYDRKSFESSKPPPKKINKPTSRLGSKYRELIKLADLTNLEKEKANKALDEVISEVRKGVLCGFRMKIRGIHAEAFGGQSGGRKQQIKKQGFTIIKMRGDTIKKDVIFSPVETIPGIKHCAVYPLGIIREFVKLLCPVNGIVLDPYLGSGTSAIAAKIEGRNYIGMDVDPVYCSEAEGRIKNVSKN